MIDKKLYRETFSRLRASDKAKKEVLLNMNEMNGKKARRPLRALRALALAAMLTLALAVTANAASGGELLEGIYQTFSITFTTANGDETFAVDVTGTGGMESLILPEHGAAATVERDGRLFLTVAGEETDITDALEKTGEYAVSLDDGTTVTVQGTVENHMILSSARDSDTYFITTHGDVDSLDGANVDLGGEEEMTVSVEPMPAADAG